MNTQPSIKDIRSDFPFFEANPGTIYLDNSATSQRVSRALSAMYNFDAHHNASPFRGLYELSQSATESYEAARLTVSRFIGASDPCEVLFTRNASESLNLISYSLLPSLLSPGDRIIIGITEHHSNMLPWRLAAEKLGAEVDYLLCRPDGTYHLSDLESLITPRTKLLAITHMSNIFGRLNPIHAMAELCHEKGMLLVADGAQSVPHTPVSASKLDVDFLAFSGHKMLAPMGIGVLYGKKELLEKMPPFLSGGEMIETVTLQDITYAPLPHRFEAGTVPTGLALSLSAACEYIIDLGFDFISSREETLTRRIMDGMKSIPHLQILGSEDPSEHHGIVTFTLDGVHPHDISAILSEKNIAVRAGHHCAMPLHQHLHIPSTTRASVMFYNTEDEIDTFLDELSSIRRYMGYAD